MSDPLTFGPFVFTLVSYATAKVEVRSVDNTAVRETQIRRLKKVGRDTPPNENAHLPHVMYSNNYMLIFNKRKSEAYLHQAPSKLSHSCDVYVVTVLLLQVKSERDPARVDIALKALRDSAASLESTSDGNHPMNLVKLSIEAARAR